tara:strand:- start:293 stop:562 length:270 start_codon:yes stop_codon:yes gene_type:complete
MESYILIQGELRSLIRNTLERFIGQKFKKKKNKRLEILLKISTRVVSSLIAIQLFNYVNKIPNFRKYTSYILIGAFVYLYMEETKTLKN